MSHLLGDLLGGGKLPWGRYVSYVPPAWEPAGRKEISEGGTVTSLDHSFGKKIRAHWTIGCYVTICCFRAADALITPYS